MFPGRITGKFLKIHLSQMGIDLESLGFSHLLNAVVRGAPEATDMLEVDSSNTEKCHGGTEKATTLW